MNSILLVCTLFGLVFAETLSVASYSVTAPLAVFGVVAILIGLVFAIYGHYLFRPMLFLAGFAFGGLLGYILLTRLEPAGGYPNQDLVLIFGSLAFAVVGGLLASCVFRLGLALIGGLGGFGLAMFILSWQTGGVISSETGRIIFIVVLVAIGAILIQFFEKPIIIIATSIFGAYMIVIGIDVFAQTGLTQALSVFLGGNHNIAVFESSPAMLWLLGSMVILTLLGIAVQYRLNRGRSFRKEQ